MDALTPIWRLFVSSLRLPSPCKREPPSRTMNSGLFQTGLFVSCASPSRPFPLQPPYDLSSSLSHATLQRDESSDYSELRLRHCIAGSPDHTAESSSRLFGTGRSPSDASHPASWRRSFGRLQAGERLLEKDLHLSDNTHLQTHGATGCASVFENGSIVSYSPTVLTSVHATRISALA
jgi:hypothetical protein